MTVISREELRTIKVALTDDRPYVDRISFALAVPWTRWSARSPPITKRAQHRRCSHRPTLMGLAMSLNIDIDSLPPDKVEAAITRLEAVKAQRVA
jgi:hypothetical protein